jgi:hypothetical protein
MRSTLAKAAREVLPNSDSSEEGDIDVWADPTGESD